MSKYAIQRVPAAQARQVLRLTLASPGQTPSETEIHVATFINHARALSLDLGQQWLAQEGGRIVAACSCLESPGRTGLLFLSAYGLCGGLRDALQDLIDHILADQAQRNLRLAQCLLNLDDRENDQILSQAGFHSITDLIYMECDVPRMALGWKESPVRTDLCWGDYKTSGHQDFAELIQATYRGSLDCPAMTGLREIEDIIAGHKSVGLFQPHRWRLTRVQGSPAGCILLGENPLRRILEVAYMGVHTARRREGLGRLLIEDALRLAYHERFEKVTLAVDAKNEPAMRLYRGAGFVETMRRRAMIRLHDSK
ncbi:MAG TPA: GNAT family N-acetyltransferase [Phycisphaerae bacterium]|nr:GNAT family N-acetyltransferase [Phycisphaerae bacterium]